MKKLFIILIIGLILLNGCEQPNLENVSEDKEELSKRDLSAYAGVCNDAGCIDEQGNIVEEKNTPLQIKTDSIEPKSTCFDECSSDSCIGTYYYKCKEQSDGCKEEIDKGRVIGKCNVECLENNDCGSGEECSYYECKPIDCGYSEMFKDGKCVGCGREHEQCCDNSECNYGNICISGICENCGFGILNQPCCELDRCFGGAICIDGKCKICGSLLYPCCPEDRCDSEYAKCVDGVCELDEGAF